MMAHSTAQGIASLGRYGDDLIVHMNQEEVQGLQALAKQHGTSLTINPKTGMPEAFKLGGVFKALIPIAAGVMFPGFGASLFGGMEGIGAGILAGAATAAITGGNPIMGGITGALGGYSGAGLGNSIANLGASTPGGVTPTMVANTTQAATATPLVGASSQFISPFTPNGIAGGAGLGVGTVGNAAITAGGTAGNALTNQAMNASLTGANTAANLASIPKVVNPSYLDNLKSGASKLFSKDGFSAYKASLPGSGGELTGVTKDAAGNVISSTYNPVKAATNMDVFKKIGLPIGGALIGGVEPSDLNPQVNLSDQEQKVYEQTGVDSAGKPTFGYIAKSAFNPYRTLNLSGPSPLNLGQALKLPATTGYADGGAIAAGGIRDLYGSTDNPEISPPPTNGYGLGRLNNLAGAQEMNTAKTYGYAHGGYLNGQGDGMSDSIPATIEGKQPARLADGEFVVPADVVSHLGNGSSKAGSKRLYAMLDKVRQARTGNKKQGKQINPARYMPA
jgi:hypothetical protein